MNNQPEKRKYKIFDYAWHIPHQFDMANALKEDCEFFLCLNTKKQWDTSQRPIPINVKFVVAYEEDVYDLAILHIDQQCIDDDNIKTIIFHQFNKRINGIPKVIINHGSPVFPERFIYLGLNMSFQDMETKCVHKIKKLVGQNVMVVNSYTAASDKEWGFGLPIVHGIAPNDWIDSPFKEPRVFTALSPFGFDIYYNRRLTLEVSECLFENYGYTLAYAKVNIDTDKSHQHYQDYLSKSLLYLDTSVRTPMNRARSEAFLSGCCVIQVEGAHDLERWAKNGENIIIVPPDALKITQTIVNFFENNYQKALDIGKNGKAMAEKYFSPERYRRDWLQLLQSLIKV